MRVAVAVDWFLDYGVHLANGLQRAGCEVLFLCRNHSAEIAPDATNPEAAVRAFLHRRLDPKITYHLVRARHSEIRASIRELVKLRRLLRLHDTEVLHYQENGDWRLLCLAVTTRIPLVYTIHDVVPHPGQSLSVRNRAIKQWYRTHADALVVHGESLRLQAEALLGSNAAPRLCVIPHGILELDDAEMDSTPEVLANKVLFFGRITKYKGLSILGEAVRALAQRGVCIDLTVAGTGPESVHNALGSSVEGLTVEIIERYLPADELSALLRQAAVVVVPYTEGSQSGVIAQAYAYGKPVVATDVGSFAEVVRHEQSGLLVPPGDAAALADALQRVVSDSDFRSALERGVQELVNGKLSWDAIGRRTMEVYTDRLATLPARRRRI